MSTISQTLIVLTTIQLSQGKFAIIDAEDFDRVNQFKWYAVEKGTTFYARRTLWIGDKQCKEYLHHFLMGKKPPMEVDHRFGNGLDNRKENLRWVTSSQNKMNCRFNAANTSGVKGVSWVPSRNKWQVYINIERKRVALGRFDSLEEALAVRQAAEQQHYGEFLRAA